MNDGKLLFLWFEIKNIICAFRIYFAPDILNVVLEFPNESINLPENHRVASR